MSGGNWWQSLRARCVPVSQCDITEAKGPTAATRQLPRDKATWTALAVQLDRNAPAAEAGSERLDVVLTGPIAPPRSSLGGHTDVMNHEGGYTRSRPTSPSSSPRPGLRSPHCHNTCLSRRGRSGLRTADARRRCFSRCGAGRAAPRRHVLHGSGRWTRSRHRRVCAATTPCGSGGCPPAQERAPPTGAPLRRPSS